MSEFEDAIKQAQGLGDIIKSNVQQELTPERVREIIEDNFEKGIISEEIYNQAIEVLEKGKSASIGEIREWDGKKYKKQGNGKWMETSSYGHTKKEYSNIQRQDKIRSNKVLRGEIEEEGDLSPSKEEMDRRIKELNKKNTEHAYLSDKEYIDEEVGLKEEKKGGVSFDVEVNSAMEDVKGKIAKEKIIEILKDSSKIYDVEGKLSQGAFRKLHIRADRLSKDK